MTTRTMSRTLVALAALLTLVGAAITLAAGAPAAASGHRANLYEAKSSYGKVLFEGDGRAVYLFTRERASRPRCYGDCARAWPPVLTSGAPTAGAGASKKRLGTVRRRDGSKQVTYRGHPLYYYVQDTHAGQILCQDVFEFGGRWLILDAAGHAVR